MRKDRFIAMAEPGDFRFIFDDPGKNYVDYVGGTLTIHLAGDVNVNCANINIECGNLTVKCAGANITAGGAITITAGGTLSLNGSRVDING